MGPQVTLHKDWNLTGGGWGKGWQIEHYYLGLVKDDHGQWRVYGHLTWIEKHGLHNIRWASRSEALRAVMAYVALEEPSETMAEPAPLRHLNGCWYSLDGKWRIENVGTSSPSWEICRMHGKTGQYMQDFVTKRAAACFISDLERAAQ